MGVALAAGPNINYPPEPKGTEVGAESLERAKLLAEKRATPQEREYIEALSARYSSDEKPDYDKLAIAYREAMRRVVHAHPNDADAAALYAEAIMDLHPLAAVDQRWEARARHDGTGGPARIQPRATRSTSGCFTSTSTPWRRVPIRGRSVAVARRLGMLPMEPAENHLVHMPAHTYLRVGDWASAIEANEHSLHGAFDYVVAENPKDGALLRALRRFHPY